MRSNFATSKTASWLSCTTSSRTWSLWNCTLVSTIARGGLPATGWRNLDFLFSHPSVAHTHSYQKQESHQLPLKTKNPQLHLGIIKQPKIILGGKLRNSPECPKYIMPFLQISFINLPPENILLLDQFYDHFFHYLFFRGNQGYLGT